jgi:NTP pyrophosphatase (non-canonical NTP hydrolase)
VSKKGFKRKENKIVISYRRAIVINWQMEEYKEIYISEAQKKVDSWIKTYGVRYFNELTNLAILTEEVGELARIMARVYGDQSFKEEEKKADLADEMADVFWVLICLANQTGVNLTEAFSKNMKKKSIRDSQRHINNEKLKK